MQKNFLFWFLILLVILFRFLMTRPIYSDGDRVRISQRILSEPVRYSNSQGIVLAGLRIYLPPFPRLFYGDRVVVEGVVDDNKLKQVKLIKVETGSGVLFKLRKRIVEFYQRSLR